MFPTAEPDQVLLKILKHLFEKTGSFQAFYFNLIVKLWNCIEDYHFLSIFQLKCHSRIFFCQHGPRLHQNCLDVNHSYTWTIVRSCSCHQQFLVPFLLNNIYHVYNSVVFYPTNGAPHGSLCPVHTSLLCSLSYCFCCIFCIRFIIYIVLLY